MSDSRLGTTSTSTYKTHCDFLATVLRRLYSVSARVKKRMRAATGMISYRG